MTDPIYTDLLDAFKQPGCPVCRLERSAVDGYLDNLFQSNLKDLEVSQGLRESLGLCREHSWQMLDSKFGDALTFSLIYHEILQSAIHGLQSVEKPPQSPRRIHSMLERFKHNPTGKFKTAVLPLTPQKGCPACEQRDRMARLALEILGVSLENEVMSNSLASSDGLCLPHLRLAFVQMQDATAYRILISISTEKLESMRRELVEIIRKNETRSKKEEFKDLRAIWVKILCVTVGEQQINRES
jgi:hypothetical protein